MEQINKNTKKKETKEEKQKRLKQNFERIAKTHQEKILLRAAIKQKKIEFIIID